MPKPSSKLTSVKYDVLRPSGAVLSGELWKGESLPVSKHVIVFCHGLLSNRDHNFSNELTASLCLATGHQVLRFDFRFDVDESLEPTYRFRFSGFDDDLNDLECVVEKLKVDGLVPWLFLGHSRGANDVLYFASKQSTSSSSETPSPSSSAAASSSVAVEDVGSTTAKSTALMSLSPIDTSSSSTTMAAASNSSSSSSISSPAVAAADVFPLAIIAISARFHMPAMYTRLFDESVRDRVRSEGAASWATKKGELLVTKEDALIVQEEFNMERVVRGIPDSVPVLVLHGEDDEVIPVQDAMALKAVRESTTLHTCPGARHAFSGKVPTRFLIKTVTEWVTERLSLRSL